MPTTVPTSTRPSSEPEDARRGGLVRFDPARGHLIAVGEPTGLQGAAYGLADLLTAIRALETHVPACAACGRFLIAPHVVFGLSAAHLLAMAGAGQPGSLEVWLPADLRRRVLEDSARHASPGRV